MTLRGSLSIIFRLSMMGLFFVGLVWVIRIESLWKGVAGIGLMLLAVPLSYEIGAAISGQHRISLKSLRSISRAVFPFVGPVVVLFVFLSTLDYYSRGDDARVFMLMLLLAPPLFSVLIDVMRGDISWDAVLISEAYSYALLHMVARLVYLTGGLLLLSAAAVAVVSLFLTLGDLIRQGLFSADPFSATILCGIPLFEGQGCTQKLVVWHGVSLFSLIIAWRYGHRIQLGIDSVFMRL